MDFPVEKRYTANVLRGTNRWRKTERMNDYADKVPCSAGPQAKSHHR